MSFDWFIFALLASILVSITGILQKIAVMDTKTDPIALSIYYQLFVGIIVLPIVFTNPGDIILNKASILLILLMSVAYAAANILYFYLLSKIEISQIKIISSTRSVWLLLGAFIFLSEPVTHNKILGIFLIIVGIISVYWNKNNSINFSIHKLLVLVYAIITAITSILDKQLLSYFSCKTTYIAVSFIFPALIISMFLPKSFKNIRKIIKFNKQNLIIVIGALCLNISVLCFFTALKMGGEISLAGPVWQSSVLFTVILSIIVLNERQNYLKKLIGAVIILAGLFVLRIPF